MTQQLTEPVRSRFTLLDRPVRSPGKCLICGSAERAVVDMRMDLEASDLQGFRTLATLYLCTDCLTEASILFLDVVPGVELRAAQSTVAELQQQIENMAGNANGYVSGILDLHEQFIAGISNPPILVHDEDDSGQPDIHDSDIEPGLVVEETVSSNVGNEGPVSIPASNGDDGESPFDF